MVTKEAPMNTWTFKRYLKGNFVDIVQTDAITMSEAVSKLSELWVGVFLYITHSPTYL